MSDAAELQAQLLGVLKLRNRLADLAEPPKPDPRVAELDDAIEEAWRALYVIEEGLEEGKAVAGPVETLGEGLIANAIKPPATVDDRFYGYGYTLDIAKLRGIARDRFGIRRPIVLRFRPKPELIGKGVGGKAVQAAGKYGWGDGAHQIKIIDSDPLWPTLRVLTHEIQHAATAEAADTETLARDTILVRELGGHEGRKAAAEIEGIAESAVEIGRAGWLLPAVVEPKNAGEAPVPPAGRTNNVRRPSGVGRRTRFRRGPDYYTVRR